MFTPNDLSWQRMGYDGAYVKKGVGAQLLRVLHSQEELATLPLNDLEQSTDVKKHAVHMRFISKHTFNARINSPSPFNSLHTRFKSTVFFPIEEVLTFSREKEGHCGYHGFLGPDPLLNRLDARTSPLPGPSHEEAQGGPLY